MNTTHEKAAEVGTPATALTKSNTATLTPVENLGKPFENLRARCALTGVTLHRIENDHGKTIYIVSRWNVTRELPDLESVARWLEKVTGGAA